MTRKFIVEIEYDRYLVECDALIADKISDCQSQFRKWLYDKTNNHGYWVAFTENPADVNNPQSPYYGTELDPDGKDGVVYGIDEFLQWLNENHLRDRERARIVASEQTGLHHLDEFNSWLKELNISQNGVPIIYF
ncbi:MAG: hypothetical protein LBT22_08700 [Peptococcaceae bacterium]|jgi:hypothetical protein|nr:hypothetical protein [Peptococcaceae bacterium]